MVQLALQLQNNVRWNNRRLITYIQCGNHCSLIRSLHDHFPTVATATTICTTSTHLMCNDRLVNQNSAVIAMRKRNISETTGIGRRISIESTKSYTDRKTNNKNYQWSWSASFSTFGPIMKKERASSRKVWRNSNINKSSDDFPVDDDDDAEKPWLLRFKKSILQYPQIAIDKRKDKSRFKTLPVTMEVLANVPSNVRRAYLDRKGCGHVLLGMNGCGKSLLISALVNAATAASGSNTIHTNENEKKLPNPYLTDETSLALNRIWNLNKPTKSEKRLQPDGSISIECVTFESHYELLQTGGSTYSAITAPIGGGQLTKAMRYLVVRFGLYPLLTRDVTTLSTGEIRKVLLIRALSQQPHLLLLDNAFDGLDTRSRTILKDIVTKTLKGFLADILVQGVNVKDATGGRTTQVLLVTNRPEEIMHQISTVTFMRRPEDGITTTEYRAGRSPKQLMIEAAGETPLELGLLTIKQFAREVEVKGIQQDPWEEESLPDDDEILTLWTKSFSKGNQKEVKREQIQRGKEIVFASNFEVKRSDKMLLSGLNWCVKHGERWWISGSNGAGKSTLSNSLISSSSSQLLSPSNYEYSDEPVMRVSLRPVDMSYISTDRHMTFAKSQQTGRDVIAKLGDETESSTIANSPPSEVVNQVAKWLNISSKQLARPFVELSQGEQKMILIAGVIALRPALLILDEPIQGLDIVNRHRVLGLIERICCATDTSLVYVTHHHDDLIPSMTHVLHLSEGKSTFKGSVKIFDPFNTLWSDKMRNATTKSEVDSSDNDPRAERRKQIFW
jgi:molybdate transport system ATP-binding protein